MPDFPKIDNAPGLVWRHRAKGMEARWVARTDLRQRGYPIKVQSLWIGKELTATDRALISDRCNSLQDSMLQWSVGGLPQVGAMDGSISGLIHAYQTDPLSPFRKKRYRTRKHYMTLCRMIEETCGDDILADIKARDILGWHAEWLDEVRNPGKPKVAMAHALVGMLRTLFGVGMTILEDDQCERLSVILNKMRFAMPKPRVAAMSLEQVIAIRGAAHAEGWHSLALAQAIQFECTLRQKDVIGEWVPLAEPGMSDIVAGRYKWLRGIRWEEIDENLILTHVTSKRNKEIIVDLKLAPMVMEEFKRFPVIPKTGPVVLEEKDGLPYSDEVFRKRWRELADKVGIPKAVRNMDTRAGAITEALAAGALLENVRKAATHSDVGMTQRYSRGDKDAVADVMKLRGESRNKPGTKAG